MTLSGNAPATLPPAEPPPEAKPAPIPSAGVFLLQNVKWADAATGKLQLGEQFSIVQLPIPLADLALAQNLSIDPQSARAKELKKNRRGCPPPVEKCVDLDLAPTSGIKASTFKGKTGGAITDNTPVAVGGRHGSTAFIEKIGPAYNIATARNEPTNLPKGPDDD